MVGSEILADARIHAGKLAAGLLNGFGLAGHAVHIGSRPAEVGNDAGKAFHLVADFLDLVQDGLLRTALDDAALVLGNRTEGAAAKATAHDVDRKADHLPGGDSCTYI